MLRLLLLLVVLGNAAFYAWAHGLMLPWGIGPTQQSEPQRMAQQLRPEAVRILGADEAKKLEAAVAASRAPECLQAAPLEEAQLAGLRTALEAWPAGSWSLEPVNEPGRWIIYMGKYASADHVVRKKAELRHLGVSFEPLSNPALEPGLSLGGHATQAAANQQLEVLAERGVRTARVVQERPDVRGQRLLLASVDDALRPRLEELRPALGGKPLRPCR